MAKDNETGVDPKAKDGQPSKAEADQLAMARARKEAEEAQKGNPIDGQEATGEDDDGQLFVYEHGQKVSLGNLIPRGVGVEHAFVFTQARRKGAGKLIPFDEDVLLVVRGKVASVKPVAKRDADEQVESVTIETQIATKAVVQADSEQAMELLAGVFARRGIKAA